MRCRNSWTRRTVSQAASPGPRGSALRYIRRSKIHGDNHGITGLGGPWSDGSTTVHGRNVGNQDSQSGCGQRWLQCWIKMSCVSRYDDSALLQPCRQVDAKGNRERGRERRIGVACVAGPGSPFELDEQHGTHGALSHWLAMRIPQISESNGTRPSLTGCLVMQARKAGCSHP
jgi:hypothetical protein